MKEKFYITTTLPYVNSKPHIGFALEIVQADALARFKKLTGSEVFFTTGTDEHGQKIHTKAQEEGKDTQVYVDEFAETFKNLTTTLNISNTHFIRTTDEHHKKAAQEMWRRCKENGDIYKGQHTINYCVGCELEKTESELVDGRCPLHPNLEIEHINEENYFFKFSAYAEKLIAFYEENPEFVVPSYRLNEMKRLIEEKGLQDFSISRLKSKMPWGVPVPDDEEHVMYVWFDALVNYISVTGWPENKENFEAWWPGVQVAGKDQVRQQAAMWQAMLMSADLPLTSQIFIHGFVTANGQKMSKSLGNVVDPVEYVVNYGVDPLRYFLLRHLHPFEDSDFTKEVFEEAYTAHLANGVGNLASRILAMAERQGVTVEFQAKEDFWAREVPEGYSHAFGAYRFDEALNHVFEQIGALDKTIQETKPFELVKTDPERAGELLKNLLKELWIISLLLEPFIPETSLKLQDYVGRVMKPENPLFPRLDSAK